MNEAIKRILAHHYGGNPGDPRAQRWLSRLQRDPNAQDLKTQTQIRGLLQRGLLSG